jgi:hypothetical protein
LRKDCPDYPGGNLIRIIAVIYKREILKNYIQKQRNRPQIHDINKRKTEYVVAFQQIAFL